MMTTLNVDLLRSFLAVAEGGNFTGAAQRLGVRQSTVSQHAARLERALGRPLLARDTHHVALTPDGQSLTSFARRVVDAHERLHGFFRYHVATATTPLFRGAGSPGYHSEP